MSGVTDKEIDIFRAIFDDLFEYVDGASPVEEGSAPERNKLAITFQIPGTPIDPEQFKDPFDWFREQGSLEATYETQKLVDQLYDLQIITYNQLPYDLSTIYGIIVQSAAKPITLSPSLQEEFDKQYAKLKRKSKIRKVDDITGEVTEEEVQIDTQYYSNYKTKVEEYEKVLGEFNKTKHEVNDGTDRGMAHWSELEPGLLEGVKTAWDEVNIAGKNDIRQAVDTIANYQAGGVLSLFADARRDWEIFKRSVRGLQILPTICFPKNWYSPESTGFSTFDQKNTSLRITERTARTDFSGNAKFTIGFWYFGKVSTGGVDRNEERTHMDKISKELRIKFDYARVNIVRPWYNGLLLMLKDWWNNTYRKKGELSNGRIDNSNFGAFPILPTGFIIARNLEIASEDLKEYSEQINTRREGKGSIQFGPFTIGGKYGKEGTNKYFESSFDGTKLTVPGSQIIAWLGRDVPYSPPLDMPLEA